MGRDKARLEWAGEGAVDRLAGLCGALGAEIVITAGADLGLPFVLDARQGPCGGILAAAGRTLSERMLVLAIDAPTLTAADLRPLLAASAPGAAYQGLPLPMVIARSAIPADAAADWPLRRLVERAALATLAAPPGARLRLRGANTPEERADLLAALG
jgi:molybdopterin-guanine dinucleotide biosynthesis protein A